MATTIVVNTETTIVVTRILTPVNGFKIQQLSGTKENVIPYSKLQGGCFKYPCDFERAFCKSLGFDSQNITILLSNSANDGIIELLTFNRIDS